MPLIYRASMPLNIHHFWLPLLFICIVIDRNPCGALPRYLKTTTPNMDSMIVLNRYGYLSKDFDVARFMRKVVITSSRSSFLMFCKWARSGKMVKYSQQFLLWVKL
jgi:hypothetical protein